MTRKKNPHEGSSFDDWLDEEGIRVEVEVAAARRVLAWQLKRLMRDRGVTPSELARRMHTSRTLVYRLLDEDADDPRLTTIARAAGALGREVRIDLAVPSKKPSRRMRAVAR